MLPHSCLSCSFILGLKRRFSYLLHDLSPCSPRASINNSPCSPRLQFSSIAEFIAGITTLLIVPWIPGWIVGGCWNYFFCWVLQGMIWALILLIFSAVEYARHNNPETWVDNAFFFFVYSAFLKYFDVGSLTESQYYALLQTLYHDSQIFCKFYKRITIQIMKLYTVLYIP